MAQKGRVRTMLLVPLDKARAQIRERIEKGRELLELPIKNEVELKHARNEEGKWSDFNAELLKRIVDTDELVDDYYPASISLGSPRSFPAQVNEFRFDVEGYITRLESILERLPLMAPESPALTQPAEAQPIDSRPQVSGRVFVVHGHDEEAKQSVARYLEKLELEAIILHEKPSQGRTIIEKFEDYADVGFAVVLLTPDDMGAAKPIFRTFPTE